MAAVAVLKRVNMVVVTFELRQSNGITGSSVVERLATSGVGRPDVRMKRAPSGLCDAKVAAKHLLGSATRSSKCYLSAAISRSRR